MSHFNLVLSTESRKAFEHVSAALGHIDAFKVSKDRQELEDAARDLRAALVADPEYLAARYYLGILEDLRGRSPDAVDMLTEIMAKFELPERAYVQYALALAYYHRYSLRFLEKAQEEAELMLASTKDDVLKAAGHALLAQIYAMSEIPKLPPENESEREKVSKNAELRWSHAQKEASIALNWRATGIKFLLPRKVSLEDRKEIDAMAYNAKGMADMYRSDYAAAPLAFLRTAQRQLERADAQVPNDWANVCDLGSCHMRIGVHTGDAAEFDTARKELRRVIDTLRPDYGFALYELGRIYRLQRNFAAAIDYFNQALAVPEKYRDVSDQHINNEMTRAEQGLADYP